ncbi:hypothetical protein ACRALDRAFT_1055239 [Sodiomyces alcalophilus JCM 7366]|uniref:uncharacterized protein n=1 Tax=Sodiomyces alcalophilus JCM 7366 TaxID=591952 RepID=UPI0039B3D3BC
MSSKMRAIDIKGGKGPRENLFMNHDVPKPTPKDGEVLVKVKAFGINRMDQIQREGHYPVPAGASHILGVEFSGTVDSLGPPSASHPDPHDFQPGDPVFGLAYGGAYAEYVAVSARMLLRKPDFMTWEQAAAIPETWITALQALHVVGGVKPGDNVLWHAGASGVSVAGIQLSRLAGAGAVFATAGTDAKCAFVRDELGATASFNYKTQDWASGVQEATGGRGVDLIIDFVGGGDYFRKNLEVAARDGKLVMLGLLGGGNVESADVSHILYKRLRIEGSTLRSRDIEYQARLRDRLEACLPDFESGTLKIVIDTILPWEDIRTAHEYIEQNKNSGKIICTLS